MPKEPVPEELARHTAHTPPEITGETIANVDEARRRRHRPRALLHRLRRHYRDPFRKIRGLTPYRIDMGVDYGGSGPVFAIGSGRVVRLDTHASWPGAHIIGIRLSRGPARGKVYYLAENLTFPPGLHVGSRVHKRTKIATLHAAFPHCETGWSRDTPGFPPLAYGCYSEGERTAAGDNFSDFLHRLGTPRGTVGGRPTRCPLPAGWPRW